MQSQPPSFLVSFRIVTPVRSLEFHRSLLPRSSLHSRLWTRKTLEHFQGRGYHRRPETAHVWEVISYREEDNCVIFHADNTQKIHAERTDTFLWTSRLRYGIRWKMWVTDRLSSGVSSTGYFQTELKNDRSHWDLTRLVLMIHSVPRDTKSQVKSWPRDFSKKTDIRRH